MHDSTFNWESETWLGDELQDYTYNSSNNELTEVTKKYNGSEWVNYEQDVNYYSGGTLDSTVNQEWDTLETDWVNTDLTTYVFDGDGNMTEMVSYSWDSAASEWDNEFKFLQFYSGGGVFDSAISQMWDSAGAEWDNISKYIYYWSGGLIDSMITQEWDTLTSGWVNDGKAQYTRDGNNNVIEWLTLSWGTGVWDSAMRVTSTYEDSLETQSVTAIYEEGNWVDYYRSTYTYDASGRDSVDFYEVWMDEDWAAQEADTFKYTGDLNTETVHYDFLTDELTKNNYEYENENMVLDIATQWVDPEWVNVSKEVWVYEEALDLPIAPGTLPKSVELSQNYPNPFNPTTVIRYSLGSRSHVEIGIYNLLGERVKTIDMGEQAAGTYSAHWNGTDFEGRRVASGVYFYTLKADNFSETKKMLLLK